VVVTQLHGYVASFGAFVRWADGGPAHRCPARDSLVVLGAIDAAYRSAASGRMEMCPQMTYPGARHGADA
jgi:hypothetical protein